MNYEFVTNITFSIVAMLISIVGMVVAIISYIDSLHRYKNRLNNAISNVIELCIQFVRDEASLLMKNSGEDPCNVIAPIQYIDHIPSFNAIIKE